MPQFQSVKFADSKVYVLNVAYQATTTKPVASVPKCIGVRGMTGLMPSWPWPTLMFLGAAVALDPDRLLGT